MKIAKLIRYALSVTVLAALGLVGCSKLDIYSIDAPSDLQHRIDSIAAAKPNTGDTTYVIITTPIVGAENNSSGWWTAFSDNFTIPSNKLLHLEKKVVSEEKYCLIIKFYSFAVILST